MGTETTRMARSRRGPRSMRSPSVIDLRIGSLASQRTGRLGPADRPQQGRRDQEGDGVGEDAHLQGRGPEREAEQAVTGTGPDPGPPPPAGWAAVPAVRQHGGG